MCTSALNIVALNQTETLPGCHSSHFAYYNFCRIHGRLRVTPAMEAGITDHVWELSEIITE